MNARRKLSASLALAATTVGLPALAAEYSVYSPATGNEYRVATTTTTSTTTDYTTPSLAEIYTAPAVTESRPVVVERTVTYTSPVYEPLPAYAAPPLIVEAPRLTTDQRITGDVVDTLAGDPRLSGTIGVETTNRRVILSGRVGTGRQMEIASRDAMSVPGVQEVINEMRPRVGPSR